jgi:hypothetical protein
MLIYWLAYPSVKMQGICFSETSGSLWSIQHYKSKNRTLVVTTARTSNPTLLLMSFSFLESIILKFQTFYYESNFIYVNK